MKILVTGANGMLGKSLCPELKRQGHTCVETDINPLDVSMVYMDICNKNEVSKIVGENMPDIIFHLAAETDVDLCEKNPEHAYHINVRGTENIISLCNAYDVLLVYISTAVVFDGEKREPYIESDIPNPINVYGQTKFEGERIIQCVLDKYFIIRVSWIIGGGNKDKKFVGKIINLIQNGAKEIKAVDDKFGSPTFADDFARNIMPVTLTGRYGLYHMANKGWVSRYQLAKKIVECMNKKVKVVPVVSDAFPLDAPRPRSEWLYNYELEQLGLNNMPKWEDGLNRYIKGVSL